jgi:hypothetical protein
MRNILFSIFSAIVILALFGGCTATVKAPSGRTTSVGVRTH